MSVFHLRFKKCREDRGLTQDQIAEVLGVSRPTIAGYESEDKQRIPRDETLGKIADFFNVSIDYLLGRTQEANPMNNDSKTVVSVEDGVYIAYLGGPPEEMDEVEAQHLKRELEEFRRFREMRRKQMKQQKNE